VPPHILGSPTWLLIFSCEIVHGGLARSLFRQKPIRQTLMVDEATYLFACVILQRKHELRDMNLIIGAANIVLSYPMVLIIESFTFSIRTSPITGPNTTLLSMPQLSSPDQY
jgi:hypothetical protein